MNFFNTLCFQQFKDPPTEYTGDHCTFEKCIVYTREFERIGGNKSELVVLKMKFIDGAFWKKLVNSKTDFSFHVLYKVTKAAKYGNLESEDFYPTNKEGSFHENEYHAIGRFHLFQRTEKNLLQKVQFSLIGEI